MRANSTLPRSLSLHLPVPETQSPGGRGGAGGGFWQQDCTYTKIGTIQRRLAWSLRKDDMQIREAFHIFRPSSKAIIRFLTVMRKHGYVGEFEIIDDHRAGKTVVNLTARLNKCGVISPRFDVQLKDLEKCQNNLLPSHLFGFIVLTTSAGIMDHEEAR
ncbi:hypothetical protein J1605_012215 [Eschrichtius robustus]|uniref:Small ribosomal subunit protein uS8 n=1 Tax=Eschrichtius robustus TaxID=9764 RepID=A0AB34GKN8_ESCRO|nr:hypothetical protein J1605_012215 [Eschrichtius robustus]